MKAVMASMKIQVNGRCYRERLIIAARSIQQRKLTCTYFSVNISLFNFEVTVMFL